MSSKPTIIKTEQGLMNQFEDVVTLIQRTRSEVIRTANTALIDLYWQIGDYFSQRIAAAEWGNSATC